MKPIDLSGLIKGLMVVIGIAITLGKLDDLKRWSAKEAFGPTKRLHCCALTHKQTIGSLPKLSPNRLRRTINEISAVRGHPARRLPLIERR